MKKINPGLALGLFLLALCSCSEKPAEPVSFENDSYQARASYRESLKKLPPFYQMIFEGGLSEDDVKLLKSDLPYQKISLERTPCFGACPVYTITLYRDGRAQLRAEQNLEALGEFKGEVNIFSYLRLCYLMDALELGKLQKSYRAPWTDSATCIITAVTSLGSQEIVDYGNYGPIQLWAIQEIMDKIRMETKWTKIDAAKELDHKKDKTKDPFQETENPFNLLKETRVSDLVFREVTLTDALQFLREMATTRDHPQWYQGTYPMLLAYSPAKSGKEINLSLKMKTLDVILDEVCQQADLKWELVNDVIVLKDK